MFVQLETSTATPIDVAMHAAFAKLGIEPLGGPSPDGWSKLADLQRCAYRYYLKHERGMTIAADVQPTSSGALEVGSLVHAAMAIHYGRRLPEGAPGWRRNMPSPFDYLEAVKACGGGSSFVSEALRLFSGYVEFYGYEADVSPLAVEFGAGEVGRHTCRYDMLAHWDGGGVAPPGLWNFETKTASRESMDVLESWWLDGEILGQHYVYEFAKLADVFGAPLQGTVINLLIKTRPPRFRRIQIVLSRALLDTYAQDRLYWDAYQRTCRARGYWPRSLQGCMSRYGPCEFWAHCRDMDDSLLQPRKTVGVATVADAVAGTVATSTKD